MIASILLLLCLVVPLGAQPVNDAAVLGVVEDVVTQTPQGEIVWEFVCPHESSPGRRAAIVRMKRLPPAYVEAIVAARTADGPPPGGLFEAMVR